MSLIKLAEQFDTEEKCITFLEAVRWPEGIRCLKCGNARISRFQASGKTGKLRHLYQCLSCRYQFSVRTGTIFHDSHLPLQKWFTAMALVGESQGSVSANQLRQVLGVQYKTAWHLAHRLREAMQQNGQDWEKQVFQQFVQGGGPVESAAVWVPREKTWVGSLPKGGTGARKPHRTETVRPVAQESARAEAYARPMESFFNLWRRGLFGSFPVVGARHLPGYMNEVTYLFGSLFISALPTGILCPFGKGLKRTLETNFGNQSAAKS